MSNAAQFARNIAFFKELWKNKVALRELLNSENFVFVRDFLPGHFYSPIPDLREVRNDARGVFDRSATELPGIALNAEGQLQLIDTFSKTYAELPFSSHPSPGLRYFLDNPYFSYGDGVILYSFLRLFKPGRIVEIGSGFSSAEMLDVNDRFFGRQIGFTFIEPYPERLHSLLALQDKRACHLENRPVQQVDPAIFDQLEENDILFIDSSHVGKIGSDVLYLLFQVLPSLRRGVLVHIHDIPWPFEYPRTWIEGGRAWNEAYFLRTFLQYNPAFEILFFNSFMATHHAELLKAKMPLALKSPSTPETIGNSSLWLRKKV